MGNWTTDKKTEYYNVRITKDAKHFPASGEGDTRKTAATFLSIVDGTKGGEDIFIDVKAVKAADKLKDLKKGAEVTVIGRVEFSIGQDGKLRGKIWDAEVKLPQATRDALKAAADAAAAQAAEAPADEAPAEDTDAPAFA